MGLEGGDAERAGDGGFAWSRLSLRDGAARLVAEDEAGGRQEVELGDVGVVDSTARGRQAGPTKRRMAAMPAAPERMAAEAFFSVTPPRAKTGTGLAKSAAERRAASPWPGVTPSSRTFSKMGEKRSREAPAAWRISS
jgi:hypothetical protein